MISLILANTKLPSFNKKIARIKNLEDNQRSVGYDGALIVEKGMITQKE